MMKTAGIIAEFNPYHNGHMALIRKAREQGADAIVVLMSGDYVQRGTPAIVDRWARAEMALSEADLVLSFPTRFATAGAEEFASAGVRILDGLGCVDTLVFGSESADREGIEKCAGILAEEPEWYRESLRRNLSEGLSFARAREAALSDYADLLRSPNDILAVEYVKAILHSHSKMEWECVKRTGAGHRDAAVGKTASASAIRAMLEDPELSAEAALPFVPAASGEILMREIKTCGAMTEDMLSDILLEKLWEAETEGRKGLFIAGTGKSADMFPASSGNLPPEVPALTAYKDVTPDLARTILKERENFRSFSSFSQRITSKTLTRSHANRALLHIALGIRRDEELDRMCCAQVLGFDAKGEKLVSRIRRNAKAETELVLRPARDIPELSLAAQALMREELRVSNLYGQLRAVHNGGTFAPELRHALIRRRQL